MECKTRIALEGRVFGRLTVISPVRETGRPLKYLCQCSCGKTTVVLGQSIRTGNTQSCGCFHREQTRQASFQHGKSRTPIHNIWSSMIQRCEDTNHKAYPAYGGRGIAVSKSWHKFENFYRDMGEPPPGMTLDRKNNDLGYSKRNCKWASRRDQANNRRSNKMITFDGRTQTQAQWAHEAGLDQKILWQRLNINGWSFARAINRPDLEPLALPAVAC